MCIYTYVYLAIFIFLIADNEKLPKFTGLPQGSVVTVPIVVILISRYQPLDLDLTPELQPH